MRTTIIPGYYDVCELVRAVTEIRRTIVETANHFYPVNTRNLEINIDQETGDFCIRDMHGNHVSTDRLYAMFPALKTDFDFAAHTNPAPEVAPLSD